MQIFNTVLEGRAYSAVIFPPNWKSAVDLILQIPSNVEESPSLLQTRRTKNFRPLLSLSYTTLIHTQEDVVRFKEFWGSVKSSICIIPLWPDTREARQPHWFDCKLKFGWDRGYHDVALYDDSIVSREYSCPAMFGRFSKPKYVGLTDGVFTMSVSFIQEPHPSYPLLPGRESPTAWNWAHNWVETYDEEIVEGFSYQQIGKSPKKVIEGYDNSKRKSSQLVSLIGDQSIGEFISFFCDRQGEVKAFETGEKADGTLNNITDKDFPEGDPVIPAAPEDTDWNEGSPVEAFTVGMTTAMNEEQSATYTDLTKETFTLGMTTALDEVSMVDYTDLTKETFTLGMTTALNEEQSATYTDLSNEGLTLGITTTLLEESI